MTTVTWHTTRSAPRLHTPGLIYAAGLSTLLWGIIAAGAALAI